MDEILKGINNFDGYYISNHGNIYSNKSGKMRKLKPFVDSKGNYVAIRIINNDNKRVGCLIHRLVATAFLPNPLSLPEINHKDNNPKNNCIDNLEWCTRKYNLQLSYKTKSPKRNCNKCVLLFKKKKIDNFDSISEAARYANEKYHISFHSLSKYLQCGEYEIIESLNKRKTISDGNVHKIYKNDKYSKV